MFISQPHIKNKITSNYKWNTNFEYECKQSSTKTCKVTNWKYIKKYISFWKYIPLWWQTFKHLGLIYNYQIQMFHSILPHNLFTQSSCNYTILLLGEFFGSIMQLIYCLASNFDAQNTFNNTWKPTLKSEYQI